MQKVKKHIGIRIFFLALFLSYFADTTFFTHRHIVNGVSIVHSHFSYPFSPDKDSRSTGHDHTANALTLIAHAQTWQALLQTLPEVPASLLIQRITYYAEALIASDQISVFPYYLRGPPRDL